MRVVALLILISAMGGPAKAQSAVSTQSGSLFPPKAGALPTQIIDLAPGRGATAERGMAARVLIKSWSYDAQRADHKAGSSEPARGGVFPDEGTFSLEPPRPDSLTEEFVNTMLGMRLGGERRLVSDKFGVVIEFTLLAVAATKAELEASLPKKKAEGPTPLKLPKLGAEWKTVDGVPYKVVTVGRGDSEILAGESMTGNAEVLEWTLDVSSPDLRTSAGSRPVRRQVAFGPDVFPTESAHLSAQLAWCMVGMKVGETRAVILQTENKMVEVRLNDLKFTVAIQTVADLIQGEGAPAVNRNSRVAFQYSTFQYDERAWGMFKSAEEKPWEKLALYSIGHGVLGTDQGALPGLLVHAIPGMKVGGIRSVLIHDDPSPGKSQVYLVRLTQVEQAKAPSETLAAPSLDAELSQRWERTRNSVVEAERKAREHMAWQGAEVKEQAEEEKRQATKNELAKTGNSSRVLSPVDEMNVFAVTLGKPLPVFPNGDHGYDQKTPMLVITMGFNENLHTEEKYIRDTKQTVLWVNRDYYDTPTVDMLGNLARIEVLDNLVEGVRFESVEWEKRDRVVSLMTDKYKTTPEKFDRPRDDQDDPFPNQAWRWQTNNLVIEYCSNIWSFEGHPLLISGTLTKTWRRFGTLAVYTRKLYTLAKTNKEAVERAEQKARNERPSF